MKQVSIAELAKSGCRYSFKETWQAMFHLSYAGFPQSLPNVHPIAAPFILWQLKGKGYSNGRVVTEDGRLVVYADR
jgi:hypothetical protein